MPDCKCPMRDRFPALLVNHPYSRLGAAIVAIAATFGSASSLHARTKVAMKETTAVLRAVEPTRPNVIVILTDDQGTSDLGVAGSTDIETPHLDALARRGVRFTQFYAAAPVCSPSRAGLLTGRHPVRAGMPKNGPSRAGQPGMPATETTLAEMLRGGRLCHRPHRQMAPGLFGRNHAPGPGIRLLVRPHGRMYRQLFTFLSTGTGPTATTCSKTAAKCTCTGPVFRRLDG